MIRNVSQHFEQRTVGRECYAGHTLRGYIEPRAPGAALAIPKKINHLENTEENDPFNVSREASIAFVAIEIDFKLPRKLRNASLNPHVSVNEDIPKAGLHFSFLPQPLTFSS